jgi:hypothetical protein
MMRLDQDRSAAESTRCAVDVESIPRTFFLASHGDIDPKIHAR